MSDLISKKELYHKLGEAYSKGYLSWGANEVVKDIIGECNPVGNKGEWIDDGFYADGHSQHVYRCSECGEHYIGYVGEFNFCPNCGADMRGET